MAFLTHQHRDTTHKCLGGLLALVSLLLLLHLLPLLWFKWTLTVIAVNLGLPFLSLLSRLGLRSKGLQTRVIRIDGACQIMTLLVSGCFPQKNRADLCIFRGFKTRYYPLYLVVRLTLPIIRPIFVPKCPLAMEQKISKMVSRHVISV
jgi:hypothetical protein